MKHSSGCSKAFILAVVWMGTVGASFSQTESVVDKNHLVEVYVPVCHFFDHTRTNWWLVDHIRFGYVYRNGKLVHKGERYVIPATLGLQYSRALESGGEVRLSAMGYFRNYGEVPNEKRGTVFWLRRMYEVLSLGYVRPLMRNRQLALKVLGELNYRGGDEVLIEFFPLAYEGLGEGFLLRDVGASIGVRVEKTCLSDFVISGEAKYTRFIYRYSDATESFLYVDGGYDGPPIDVFTLQFGLGYRF